MKNSLKTGIMTAAGSQLANVVSRSEIGTNAFDKLNMSYDLEHFINGVTQAGAFAGLTIAAYGLTKAAVEKGVGFASEKTATSAALTSATSVAYALAKTETFQNALYDVSMYNHQIQNALEAIAAVGITAGLIATGTLLVKDVYDLASSKVKKSLSKKA